MDKCLEVAIPRCYFCGKEKNELIMNTTLTPKHVKKVKEAHGKVINTEPCDKCKEIMKQGVMLIGCKDDDPDYRTGLIVGVKDEAVPQMFPPEYAEKALKMRVLFVGETAWKGLGLPEGPDDVE